MNARQRWAATAITLSAATAALALTMPSASDGPVKLLSCVVTQAGILEAEVDSRSDDAMSCDIRCDYELSDRMFSHTFSVTIPARFQGSVGEFDTSNARAGSYQGVISNCEKVQR